MGTYTHSPRIFDLLLAAIGCILLLVFGRRFFDGSQERVRTGVLLLVILAGLLGANVQIMSGYDAQHGHFWNRLVQPVVFFVVACRLCSSAESRLGRHRSVLRYSVMCLIAAVALNAAARQVRVGVGVSRLQKATDPGRQLLVWARNHLPAESVIGTVVPELILTIPAITADFNYVPSGLRSLTSTEEIVTRFDELASLIGLSQDQVLDLAKRRAHLQPSELLLTLGCGGTPDDFGRQYGAFRGERLLQGRRLDYLVLDANVEVPRSVRLRFPGANVIYKNDHYELVELRPSNEHAGLAFVPVA